MSSKFSEVSSLFTVGAKDFQFSKDLELFLNQFKVGGLALFNSPFDNPLNIWKDADSSLEVVYEFMKKLSLRSNAPFVAVDQEGGRVRRMRGHFIALPSAREIATAHREAGLSHLEIRKLYELAAEQLAYSQIHLNFAPVCDLSYPASEKIVGDRSFASSMKEALPLIETFLGAFKDKNVATCMKHLPGHGPTEFDSHDEVAVTTKTKDEMLREDFVVFKKAADRSSAVMTAHIAFADEPERVFSLDRDYLSEFREKLPKHLAWFTDDLLSMKAVSETQPWIKAFEADYDFILVCGELDATVAALEETIRHLESTVKNFHQETQLENRYKRSNRFFAHRPKKELLPFKAWREKILELKKQAEPFLSKIKSAAPKTNESSKAGR